MPVSKLSQHLAARLFGPVDVASLVVFRVAFGLLMLWQAWQYLRHDAPRTLYLDPPFLFKYLGFAWVEPWPGAGMTIHFVALGVLGLLVAAGLCYRLSASLFCLGFTYFFLLERGRYLNHFYLVCLLSFLMAFVPAHRSASLDARLLPGRAGATVPAWSLWLLRFQVGVVYFFAGVAKLNGEWLRGEPMRGWLATKLDYPIFGAWCEAEWLVYLFSYGGLLFDLLVVPGLLWRRTRPIAFALAVGFHLTNAWQFDIDVFPWLMIAATTLFLDPDWPRRLLARLRRTAPSPVLPVPPVRPVPASPPAPAWRRRAVLAALGAWAAVQVLLPLRHLLYPGNVLWTDEGDRFAWHMLLKNKRTEYHFVVSDLDSGRAWRIDPARDLPPAQVGLLVARPRLAREYVAVLKARARAQGLGEVHVQREKAHARFHLRHPGTGETWTIDPVDNGMPAELARRMSGTPDMLLQYAHELARRMRLQGHGDVEVRVESRVSLHGRPYQPIVDPAVDLAAQPWSAAPAPWIVPLAHPLPGAEDVAALESVLSPA